MPTPIKIPQGLQDLEFLMIWEEFRTHRQYMKDKGYLIYAHGDTTQAMLDYCAHLGPREAVKELTDLINFEKSVLRRRFKDSKTPQALTLQEEPPFL